MQVTDVVPGLAAGVGIDLEPGAKSAYYVEWSIGELSRVDVTTGSVSTVLKGLEYPEDVEVDWQTGQIFVSERTGAVIEVLANEGKRDIANPGGAPHQLDLKRNGGRRFLYTVCFDSGDLLRIDLDSLATATVASGLRHPVGIVVDEAQQFAYVTEQDTGALTRVELGTGIAKQLITALIRPFFLAWDRNATGIFCVQRDPANNLLRLDLGSLKAEPVAEGLAWRPSGVATDDGSLIYVTADRVLQVISQNGPPPLEGPVPPFEIHSIEFTFDGSLAIPLRDHLTGTAVPAPEYLKGVRNEPASFVAGSLPQVRVVLAKLGGFSGGAYSIGAIGSLGGIRRRSVTPTFDGSGLSAPIDFEFMWPIPSVVAKPDVSLDWYARPANVPAVPAAIGSALHRLYIPLAHPVEPWTGECWVGAFEVACSWAAGAATLDDAAALITERYNGSGMVSYDTAEGFPWYEDALGYHLSEMLERLAGGPGWGEKVNCTDSACTVTTLSNLLGCELWESEMRYQFALNPVIAIGYHTWAVPFQGFFAYHEVAWKGDATANEKVFDGCLKVDGDEDPTSPPHTPLLPTNMLFGDCSTMTYRLRLCTPDPTGCAKCIPQPATTRQRRPIV